MMMYYSISAKSGENVFEMFRALALSLSCPENSILSPQCIIFT